MIQPLYLCGYLQAAQKCKSQNYNGQQHFKDQTEISVLLYVNNKMETSIWPLTLWRLTTTIVVVAHR